LGHLGPDADSEEGGLTAFYARVRDAEDVGYGFAIEHAQAVCRSLYMHLDESRRKQLTDPLWKELTAPGLEARFAESAPTGGRTLADGRPGSRHPVATAQPPTYTHGESVQSDNPHGDRKLSSGHISPDDEQD
jgi:hypothetical protein